MPLSLMHRRFTLLAVIVLLAPALVSVPGSFSVVHVNAEFGDQASEHDPQVARFLVPP